jgi:CheY-specific phosphatase CheX
MEEFDVTACFFVYSSEMLVKENYTLLILPFSLPTSFSIVLNIC